jgi:hypothetical protein
MKKSESDGLTRRATLKGAGLAVGTLWVAPLVQVISMDSAAAASAPPARTHPIHPAHPAHPDHPDHPDHPVSGPRG